MTSTSIERDSKRADIARETNTVDPIFLFQQRRVIYFVNHSGFEWPEGWTTDDDGLYNAGGEALNHEGGEKWISP